MKTELLCFMECLRFGARHPRYLLILVMLYGASLRRWRRMRAARLGYAFLQLFDDLMDGDRESAETTDQIATRVMAEWSAKRFAKGDTLSRLGEAFQQALREMEKAPEDRPEEDTITLLRLMHEDARRRHEKRISTEAELQAHLRQTFSSSVNLLLLACGHRLRAADLPALVAALAWCSVVRDFDEDARKGLINVPREVLAEDPMGGEWEKKLEIRNWLDGERARGAALLRSCEDECRSAALRDPPAARLAGLFVRSMYKHCRAA